MADIHLITEENFKDVSFKFMLWDVEVRGVPYQVVRADGYAHAIGGKLDWGDGNEFWAYPLGKPLTFGNLVEFDGEPGATWGLEYTPTNYIRSKWGETEIMRGRRLIITRNGKPFCDCNCEMTFHQAIACVKDGVLDEHPLNLNDRDFDKRCIGRKIWWRSEPAIITDYINGQASIIFKPDGIEHFTVPKEFAREDPDYYCEKDVKTSIFDKNIWWFRED